MTRISELHRRWSRDANYYEACDAQGEESDLALIRVAAYGRCRTCPGLILSGSVN